MFLDARGKWKPPVHAEIIMAEEISSDKAIPFEGNDKEIAAKS
jgi:hypothetical protein